MAELAEDGRSHISCHVKRTITKTELDNIYFGVCKISNSFERLMAKLTVKRVIPKIKIISEELSVCKKLIEKMYYKFGLIPKNHVIYIDAANSKEFIDKLQFIISDTIFRCAAVSNSDNLKKFTDFSLITMVLADLGRNLAL